MDIDAPSPPQTEILLAGPPGLPKYLQLKDALLARIEAGQWQPGEQLPAEDVLARLSGLSLGTVQRSLRMLVDEGLLVRKHGSGTFVARQRRPLGGPFHHFRFLSDDGEHILPIYTKVLKRYSAGTDGPWYPLLRSAHIYCIDRKFSINNEFDLFVQFYFCAKRFPELAETASAELTGVSFKDLLSRQHRGLVVSYAERLQLQALPDAVARLISVPAGSMGARLEITALDARGDAVYLQYAYLPPNSRQLILQP